MRLHFVFPLAKFVAAFVLSGLTSVGCRTELPELAQLDPPTQRVKAQTGFYLGLYADQVSLDTAIIAGTIYPVNAKDSSIFSYDSQQRLIGFELIQTGQAYAKKFISKTRNEYTYEVGKIREQEGLQQSGVVRSFQYRLDAAQRRVLSRNKQQYAYLQIDTLREYSNEGILINNLGGSLPYLEQQKVSIEMGNAIQVEVYVAGSGRLLSNTRLVYDKNHFAPLAAFTFLGENSRNALLKKIHTVYKSDGITVDYVLSSTFYNEYDSQGRMIRQTEYFQGGIYPQKKALTLTKYYY